MGGYLNNKKMKYLNLSEMEMLAHEAFIRRAAQVDLPFMLKGSYVTRQYFPPGVDRAPADLDWVYLGDLADAEDAEAKFDEWVLKITEIDLDDKVKFRNFSENHFWRMIDYAMADDFPTVNTDILCWVNGEKLEFGLDLSFNLDVQQPPVSLRYNPLSGEPFIVSKTVPLSLQVSWKIHQTLVRPRFKDLFDLIFLVQHESFNTDVLKLSLQALVNECAADNIDLARLSYFLNYEIEKLFPSNSLNGNWNMWRHDIDNKDFKHSSSWDERARFVTELAKLPEGLDDFLMLFSNTMRTAGFTVRLLEELPKPMFTRRKTYKDMSNRFLYNDPDLKPHIEPIAEIGHPVGHVATDNEEQQSDWRTEAAQKLSDYNKPKNFFDFFKRVLGK
jgi:hypothetical protein